MRESSATVAHRIMQQVFDGEIIRKDFAKINDNGHRAYAAIAWLLLHPEGRLDDNLYVLGSFHKVLSQVTGRDESRASDYTTNAGITTSASPTQTNVPAIVIATSKPTCRGDYQLTLRRSVRITPPVDLLEQVKFSRRDPMMTQLVENLAVARSTDAILQACLKLDAYLN